MRKESSSTKERNSPIAARLKEIKSEHPFWGYRRIWAYLKYIDGLDLNKKRVLRLMQRLDLVVKPDTKSRLLELQPETSRNPFVPISGGAST